jgi:hypothetical protein
VNISTGACIQDILWSRHVDVGEVHKLSELFQTDFGRKSFTKLLDKFVQDVRFLYLCKELTIQYSILQIPSAIISENSFEMLLFLINTMLQEMDLSDRYVLKFSLVTVNNDRICSKDLISVRMLMRCSCSLMRQTRNGVMENIHVCENSQ